MFTRSLLLAAFCALALNVVLADLPIHCRHEQVLGKWTFELGKNDGDVSETCGYDTPDDNRQHFESYNYKLKVLKTIQVELSHPNKAKIVGSNVEGTWTMVYDEGFEVTIDGKVFFAFFEYEPKEGTSLSSKKAADYISHCDRLRIGWYHNTDNTKWGCFRAAKEGASKLETVSAMSQAAFLEVGVEDETKMFTFDLNVVEAVNADASSLWKARVPVEFLGKSVGEMNRMLGRRRTGKNLMVTARAFKQTPSEDAKYFSEADEKMHKELNLPLEWDWRNVSGVNYVGPVRQQGSCGSCYAVAGVGVAESRLRVATQNADTSLLSPQGVTSCSVTNQGCNGGYPFLVAKHAAEVGIVTEECFPYQVHAGCSEQCKNAKKYYAKNYEYVGGWYGGCNELDMMKAIYKGGPIITALQAPRTIYYYSHGVFTGPRPKSEPGWEETNHAVIIVGWGVDRSNKDKPVKYWIIKNSWGPHWGDKGHFKMARGSDECGVESMAVTFDFPVKIDDPESRLQVEESVAVDSLAAQSLQAQADVDTSAVAQQEDASAGLLTNDEVANAQGAETFY